MPLNPINGSLFQQQLTHLLQICLNINITHKYIIRYLIQHLTINAFIQTNIVTP